MAKRVEVPDFVDFSGADTCYNTELMVETVIWPLVDELWRGDWRQDSQHCYEFQFPRRGLFHGRTLDVRLQADSRDISLGKGEPLYMRTAGLAVEEVVSEKSRDRVLSAAYLAACEEESGFQPIQDEEDDDGDVAEMEEGADFDPDDWPQCADDELIVKKGVLYLVSESGMFNSEIYRAVEGPHDRKMVQLCAAEMVDLGSVVSDNDILRAPDLETIEAACFVLNASFSIMKALEAIRAQPYQE